MINEKIILNRFNQLTDVLKKYSNECTFDAIEMDAQIQAKELAWVLGINCPDYRKMNKKAKLNGI